MNQKYLDNLSLLIEKQINESNDIGLNGNSGVVLFYFYLYKHTLKEVYADKAIHLLHNIIGLINNSNYNSSLYSGISGVAWLIEHLTQSNFIELDFDELLSENLEDYIYNSMIKLSIEKQFDFHDGTLGHFFYFIYRYKNTRCTKLRAKYKEYIIQIIFFLENQRLFNFYRQDLENLNEKKYHKFNPEIELSNLINLLIRVLSLNIVDEITIPILSYYSDFLYKNIKKNKIVQPETVLCMLRSGEILNNSSYRKVVETFFKDHLNYDYPENIITFYKKYKVKNLLTNKLSSNNEGFLNLYIDKFFKNFESSDLSNCNLGLWDGLSGIGLCIITLENEFLSSWDDCFFIN